MAIIVETTEMEEAVYKEFAEREGVSVSDLIRQTMSDMVEDYYDAKAADKAIEEMGDDPEVLSHEEFWDGLV